MREGTFLGQPVTAYDQVPAAVDGAELVRGEVDIAYLLDVPQAQEVKKDPNLKLAFSGGIATWYLDFLDQWDPKSPWHDRRVRLAPDEGFGDYDADLVHVEPRMSRYAEVSATIFECFAEVTPERVIILAETAERPDEIDRARAELARQRAEQRMTGRDPEALAAVSIEVDIAVVVTVGVPALAAHAHAGLRRRSHLHDRGHRLGGLELELTAHGQRQCGHGQHPQHER